MRHFVLLCVALHVCAFASQVSAASAPGNASCHADAAWTEPAAPMHIYGDTWFVGTCGISSILIASKQGHVLIDGGVVEAAPLIEANIRKLGFRVEDVRYILNSHEHSDHAGGIAQLQRDSHAVIAARAPAAAAMMRGHGDRSDPQFLSGKPYPAVEKNTVRTIVDGEKIRLGAIELTAHATPGHTPGSTSWTWKSCENDRCLDIVYADSFSAISDDVFRYSDEAAHPGYVNAFRHSIETIAALPCDILLTPHPDASDLWNRLGVGKASPLIDAGGCRRYAATATENLDMRLNKERAGKTP